MTSIAHDDPAGLTALSDEALVHRAQSGSLDCFTEILQRFEYKIFNFILKRIGGGTRHRADAEDLTQETFLRAWRSLADFRPTHRFTTWLFTIAGRLVVDHLRHRRVRLAAVEFLAQEAIGDEAAGAHDPVEAAHRAERASGRSAGAVWELAQRVLSDESVAALWLRYAEDLSPGEIAHVLERSEVSVRVMLFRARQTLAPFVSKASDDGETNVCAAAGGVA